MSSTGRARPRDGRSGRATHLPVVVTGAPGGAAASPRTVPARPSARQPAVGTGRPATRGRRPAQAR
ncbi:hypothetical protein E4K10_34125 [Streptomyces sp. T1317-0309]|nr:hypothetical protein E4K10_34125 [Streptomyces sp. T1317-0309]